MDCRREQGLFASDCRECAEHYSPAFHLPAQSAYVQTDRQYTRSPLPILPVCEIACLLADYSHHSSSVRIAKALHSRFVHGKLSSGRYGSTQSDVMSFPA